MPKDKALKMAIEALDTLMMEKGSIYQQALQACKHALEQPLTRDWKETIDERIAKDDAFKQALEQPAQEPVALVIEDKLADWSKPYVAVKWNKVDFEIGTKFYTHPAPSWQGNKEFVGLSDDERFIIVQNADWDNPYDIAELIEQALKEKNTC